MAMKERPILFSTPMIHAIQKKRKTVTRRIVKPQPIKGEWIRPLDQAWLVGRMRDSENAWRYIPCPYGQPGDHLWVRENTWIWCLKQPNGTTKTGRPKFKYVPLSRDAIYCADHPEKPVPHYAHPSHVWKFKPARFMPRWASRISLEVKGIQAERLQDITEEQAAAEGVEKNWIPSDLTGWSPVEHGWINYLEPMDGGHPCASTIESFRTLWESINGTESYELNPWVFAIEFKPLSINNQKEI